MKNRLFAIFWLSCLLAAALANLSSRQIPSRPALARDRPRRASRSSSPPNAGHRPKPRWPRAENAYKKLAAFWRGPPAGRIRIVLDDSTDQANGFATFFPFNLVGVNLAEPPPDSELAGSRELARPGPGPRADPYFHPERGRRAVPHAAPGFRQPAGPLSGRAIAALGHRRAGRIRRIPFTGDGRLNHPPYPLMLAAARRDGLFPGWSRIAGMPAAWPGPAAKYLFGAGFMEFLADKYGADSLRRYLERVDQPPGPVQQQPRFQRKLRRAAGQTLGGVPGRALPTAAGPGSRAADGRRLSSAISLPPGRGQACVLSPRLPKPGRSRRPGPENRPGKDPVQDGRGQRPQRRREREKDTSCRPSIISALSANSPTCTNTTWKRESGSVCRAASAFRSRSKKRNGSRDLLRPAPRRPLLPGPFRHATGKR